MRDLSPTKQKILLLLLGGLGLGFAYTFRQQKRLIKELAHEWRSIDREKLKLDIQKLYQTKLVGTKKNPDGSWTFTLTNNGKMRALTYHFHAMRIKREKWDGNWRAVIFDIPEKLKNARNALRIKLRNLGFYELQKSVFVFPFECKNEIEFILEFFNLRPYVRFGVFSSIDNYLHLKTLFKL